MRILILGGTVFLGRHLVAAAQADGHTVTLFNRGQHNPDLFPDVEKLRGDRDGGLDALRGRQWDAVIDTSGYLPRVVRQSVELLKDATGHYTFVSTMSVYADLSTVGITEASPTGSLPAQWDETQARELYGPLKAACEREVRAVFGDAAFIPRPGLIVGPFDQTNRFTYWPHRIAQGGTVLAPNTPDTQIRFNIDVRDLAEWIVRAAEAGTAGTYNAQGPTQSLTMGELLDTCRTVSGSDAQFVWMDEQFLLDAGVRPWMELPLWVPAALNALHTARIDRAVGAGLTFRPLTDTVRDTLAWDRTQPTDVPRPAGLAPERERELLATWQARQGG